MGGAREMADQLIRASGKISACIAEGYSRNTGKARAVFYEYACGSARESRDWHYNDREVLHERRRDQPRRDGKR